MYYTIYTSTPRKPISVEALNEIVSHSKSKNTELGITGILLGIENKYLQYIEGPEEAVKNLIKKIKMDSRHYDMVQWVTGFTKERSFEKWSMASWMLSKTELESLTAQEDFQNFLNNPSNEELQSKKFIEMMNGLLKTWIEKNKD